MSRRFGGVLTCAAAAALCLVSTQSGAEVPATPANGIATVTVTYELKGAGVERPASNERNVTWTLENRYTVTATLTAQKPAGFAAMHKPDAAEQAREAGRMAAATQAAGDMQSMMAQVEQIMKICGDDEACITRESVKMSQGIDMNAPEMQSAQANIAKVSAMPDARYQIFQAAMQQGSFAIKENAHEAYFDAACSFATEERCAYDTAVSGTGDLTDPSGAKLSGTIASAEIDYQTGSLLLTLPFPGLAKVTKTVTSRNPQIKTGSTEAVRMLRFDDVAKEPVQASCGDCRTASGSFERDVPDQLLGRPAKLVVSWTFSRS